MTNAFCPNRLCLFWVGQGSGQSVFSVTKSRIFLLYSYNGNSNIKYKKMEHLYITITIKYFSLIHNSLTYKTHKSSNKTIYFLSSLVGMLCSHSPYTLVLWLLQLYQGNMLKCKKCKNAKQKSTKLYYDFQYFVAFNPGVNKCAFYFGEHNTLSFLRLTCNKINIVIVQF